MNSWKITYTGWEPKNQKLREALCTLGNGYFATRGAAEESVADDNNYPGTYLAGGYNRMVSEVSGRKIENEDLVNWPNWLYLNFSFHDGEWFSLQNVKILDYIQELDLKEGILSRNIRFENQDGKITQIVSRRIVSMADKHVAAIEWTIIPENWSGMIKVRSGIDASVTNSGVARYNKLKGNHLELMDSGSTENNLIYSLVRTKQSDIRMAQVAKTIIHTDNVKSEIRTQIIKDKSIISSDFSLECRQGKPVKVEKIVTLHTSKDFAISEPLHDAKERIQRITNFSSILDKHKNAWKQIWSRCNLEMDAEYEDQLILRLHIFHIFQTVSSNSVDLDIGVPSRGWHGEAYRGHIFWDEIYIFPFLNLHVPELTRSLLMYRYRRLQAARFDAQKEGYRGAMFPWQSGSNGREETQTLHLNPKSGRWLQDETHLQRHINSAIAYNVWQYYQVTGDMEFLTYFGAEMILSIALFWSSIAHYNPQRDKYEIHGIVGPDEYHTKYPGSEKHGLNNNAYTNIMAVWVIKTAIGLLDLFDDNCRSELFEKTGINQEDLNTWQEMTRKMYVPFIDKDIISQFEGYDQLKEFDWDSYTEKYGNIMRLDRILEQEHDSPDNYKASKQADLLMLFYLFSADELSGLFERLNYPWEPEMVNKNIEYYQQRTSHGSTLSQLIHSWVYARADRSRSWSSFKKALVSDFKDVQGGTTSEGIHLGAMAGTVDLVQRCYTGIEIHDDVLWLNPTLPDDIRNLKLQIRYRSHWIDLHINHNKLVITFDKGWANPVYIGVNGKKYLFERDSSKEFAL